MALPKLRSFKKNQKGFISIVALGIFALLVIVGLTVMESNVETAQSIKNTSKYYEAQDIADSVMEYLQYTMKDMEAGFSIVKADCKYGGGEVIVEGEGLDDAFEDWVGDLCVNSPGSGEFGLFGEQNCINSIENTYSNMACENPTNPNGENVQKYKECVKMWFKENKYQDTNPEDYEVPAVCNDMVDSMAVLFEDKNVEITVNVEGKSEYDDYFDGCFGILENEECYVVPIPGSGTAGENCEQYKSYAEIQDKKGANDQLSESGKAITDGDSSDFNIPRIDHPCNWNKLKFGSSSTDRVSIPFYYVGDDGIVNPYNVTQQLGSEGENFVLRMRGPCPDEKGDCEDHERHIPTEYFDKILVQWQLSGECVDGECGLIPNIDFVDDANMSAISGKRINGEDPFLFNNIVLGEIFFGRDINNYKQLKQIGAVITGLTRPVLSIYLGKGIKDFDGKNIPYLEYQLLTDRQIGSPTTKMEVIVSVDGNTYKKVLYQQEQKALVDFAVQN